MTPVYLDCDTGIDDALALGYLLATPEVRLVGIGTVHGNISAAGGAENTLRLLGLAATETAQDVPVAVGENDPLTGTFGGGAVDVHGEDGVGGVRERSLPPVDTAPEQEDAADLLLRLSHEYAGELRVIAIGPLTNLAVALQRDPTLVQRVHPTAGVTLMGGAAMVPGNVTALAEANIANDPEAAQAVVSADWPVTVVPLDVTMQEVFEQEHISTLQASEVPVVAAIGEMLDGYADFYTGVFGRRCCALHDPLAAAVALDEVPLVRAPKVPVEVDVTDGPGRGQTVCDLRQQRTGHGKDVDVKGAHVRVLLETGDDFAARLVERLQML